MSRRRIWRAGPKAPDHPGRSVTPTSYGAHVCLACRRYPGPLCRACRLDLRSVPPAVVNGVLVASAFAHTGAAVALVHRLKYDGVEAAAGMLAAAMAPLVPAHARCLVPVPRATARLWRHGVDGGEALARRLGGLVGLPVRMVLPRPLWHPRQAGKSRSDRRSRPFGPASASVSEAVVVDDVLTTGATLEAAVDAVGDVIGGVTATRSGGTSLFMRASS